MSDISAVIGMALFTFVIIYLGFQIDLLSKRLDKLEKQQQTKEKNET